MKKNQHIINEKTYKRFISDNENIFMIKNNDYLILDWSYFNNKIQQKYYWEDERFADNEIEDNLHLFEKQWGLLRQSILSSEFNKNIEKSWQKLYYLLLIWLKSKIDEHRTIIFRDNNDFNKSDKIKLLKLLEFFSSYYNFKANGVGPKMLEKKEFLNVFFTSLDDCINKNLFWSYPLTGFVPNSVESVKKQKFDLENLDFANHTFWFVREMLKYTPNVFILSETSMILPFERKVDIEFLYNSKILNSTIFNKLKTIEYNVLFKYKYFYWIDEYIYFGYKKNITELIYDYKYSIEKATIILFNTNVTWLNRIKSENNINNKLEMFLDMIGYEICLLSKYNIPAFNKLDIYFSVMQNQLDNCLFLFERKQFLEIKEVIDDNKNIISEFYQKYNFNIN